MIQSILMNLAMFALVHLCVNINAREVIVKMEERVFTGTKIGYRRKFDHLGSQYALQYNILRRSSSRSSVYW